MKEIKINHGIPQSSFFMIAQPKKDWGFARTEGEVTIVTLTNPETKQPSKAELHAVWTMGKAEFLMSEGFSKLVYGVEPKYVWDRFKANNPALKDDFEVEYWLLKRI